MDGPTANWAVLNNHVENQKRELSPVEDIGSFSLHIVSVHIEFFRVELKVGISKRS